MKYEDFAKRLDELMCNPPYDIALAYRALYDEMTKPMGVEEIEKWLAGARPESELGPWAKIQGNFGNGLRPIAEILQPLTRKQGFVVDWDEADTKEGSWVYGWRPYAIYKDGSGVMQRGVALSETIHRPTLKYQKMTARQKNVALRDFICLNPNFDFGDADTVEGMLTAAGIQTKIEVKE